MPSGLPKFTSSEVPCFQAFVPKSNNPKALYTEFYPALAKSSDLVNDTCMLGEESEALKMHKISKDKYQWYWTFAKERNGDVVADHRLGHGIRAFPGLDHEL